MSLRCPISCQTCTYAHDPKSSCFRDEQLSRPALRPGGLRRSFVGFIQKHMRTHPVRVLSQHPWIVVVDDFIRDHEIRALLDKGGRDFKPSSISSRGPNKNKPNDSRVRKSLSSFCDHPYCDADPVIQALQRRVANATGIPMTNFDFLQLVKYDIGGFYRLHHDQDAHPSSPWGPRVITILFYLSDVQSGGGTHFPLLNITVAPKRGRAVLWPSMFDSDPSGTVLRADASPPKSSRGSSSHDSDAVLFAKYLDAIPRTARPPAGSFDFRTVHEAMEVKAGHKLVANLWLRLFDTKRPRAAGCS